MTNLTFTRYMVPSGKGVTEHPQGMLYLRADVDPLLDKLEAERDAERDNRVVGQATVEFSEMAASLVEDMSRKPNTTWGQVKGAIRALGDIGDRDILAERDKRVRDEALREAARKCEDLETKSNRPARCAKAILALIEGDDE